MSGVKENFIQLVNKWLKVHFHGFLVGFLFGVLTTIGGIVYYVLV